MGSLVLTFSTNGDVAMMMRAPHQAQDMRTRLETSSSSWKFLDQSIERMLSPFTCS